MSTQTFGSVHLPRLMGEHDGEHLMMAFTEAGYPHANVQWFDEHGWLVEVLAATSPPAAIRERAYALVAQLLPQKHSDEQEI